MDDLTPTESDGATPAEVIADPDEDLISALNEDDEESTETPAPRKVRVKINDVEEEVDEADLIAKYQKETAAERRFQEAAAMRKEAEDAIQQREQYVQKQQYLQQAIERIEAQAQLWAGDMPTPEQLQQLLNENPHEYMKVQAKIQQRQAALQQLWQTKQAYQQQQAQEQQAALEKQMLVEGEKLLTLMPEWKDEKVRIKEASDLKSYLMTQGYSDQDWQYLTQSKAENFRVLKKAMLYDRLIEKANAAKAKPKPEDATPAPVTTLSSKAPARQAKSIVDMNLTDKEFLDMLAKDRQKRMR